MFGRLIESCAMGCRACVEAVAFIVIVLMLWPLYVLEKLSFRTSASIDQSIGYCAGVMTCLYVLVALYMIY